MKSPIPLSSPLTLQDNGNNVFSFSGSGLFNLSNMTLNGSAIGLSIGTNTTATVSNVIINDRLVINGGALSAAGSVQATGGITLTGVGTIATASGQTTTFSGSIGGTGSLNEIGSGTLVLTNTNGYSGGTSILGGILSISSDANLGNASGTLILNGGTLQTATGIETSRIINLAGAGTIDVTNSGAVTELDGSITGNGLLTKVGLGTLDLTNLVINQSTGGIAINGGTLRVSDDSQLGATGNEALTFNAGTLQTPTGIVSNRNITLVGAGTFDVTNAGTLTELNGTITGSGSLTKTGAGTLTLTQTNTYSGGTVISAGTGTLKVQATNALGNGMVTNGAQLNVTNSAFINNTVFNGALASLTFSNNSSAGISTITNGGFNSVTSFLNNASAGHATIANLSGGSTVFKDNSNAGLSSINNFSGGTVQFLSASTADQAAISNSSTVDLSDQFPNHF